MVLSPCRFLEMFFVSRKMLPPFRVFFFSISPTNLVTVRFVDPTVKFQPVITSCSCTNRGDITPPTTCVEKVKLQDLDFFDRFRFLRFKKIESVGVFSNSFPDSGKRKFPPIEKEKMSQFWTFF